MIFPSEAVLAAREELVQSAPGKTPAIPDLEKLLAIDPDYGPAQLALAFQRDRAGDQAGAEQMLRRGMTANPYDYKFPMTLAGIVGRKPEGKALAQALLELAAAKLQGNPEQIELANKVGVAPPRFTDEASLQELATELRALRETEPAEVTAELKAYRLIHDLEEALGNELERELVDAILAEREACRPLLIGILRGLAEGALPEGGELMGEAALALLGEIADPESLPALVQFAVVDDEGLSDTAGWALQRSARLRPAESLAAFRNFDRRMGGAERACMSETIATMAETPGRGDALLALFENFGVTAKAERTDIFVMLSAALLHAQGKAAPPMIRATLQELGPLLEKEAKKATDDLLRAWTAEPSLFEVPPNTPSTVYEICCADRMAGDDDEDEEEEEHVHGPGCKHHAPPPPGRNEPCWCGSGKKYKKCHLAADEEARLKAPAEE